MSSTCFKLCGFVFRERDCVCRMVCFTFTSVSSLLPTRLLTPISVKYTILHIQPVFLRMNPQGSKHAGNIRN